MGFLFKDKDLKFIANFATVIFIVFGFLWTPLKNLSAERRGETAAAPPEYKDEETDNGALHEVDWDDPDYIKKHMTQSYGKTQFAAAFAGLSNSWHNGIDINVAYGAPIYSQSGGKVVFVGDQDKYCKGKGYGKFVMIENSDGDYTLLYAHFSKITVKLGEEIERGEIIGHAGESGLATGPHLHFSVFKTSDVLMTDEGSCGPKPVGGEINPLKYLD